MSWIRFALLALVVTVVPLTFVPCGQYHILGTGLRAESICWCRSFTAPKVYGSGRCEACTVDLKPLGVPSNAVAATLYIKLKSHVYPLADGPPAGTQCDMRVAKTVAALNGCNHCAHCEWVQASDVQRRVDYYTVEVPLSDGTFAIDYQYRIDGRATTEMVVYVVGFHGCETPFQYLSGLMSEAVE